MSEYERLVFVPIAVVLNDLCYIRSDMYCISFHQQARGLLPCYANDPHALAIQSLPQPDPLNRRTKAGSTITVCHVTGNILIPSPRLALQRPSLFRRCDRDITDETKHVTETGRHPRELCQGPSPVSAP